MAELEIPADQVPAEALAAFSNEASPAPIANEVEVDPVDSLDAAGLFELSKNKMFSPLEYAQQNPDKATNPDVVRKLSDTHARIRERGFTFSDLPSVSEAAKGVGHMIAGGAKQAWNYLNAFVGIPLAGLAGAVTGQGAGFNEELDLEGQRRMIETAAGTEQAITGLSQLPGRAIGKVVHRAGTISGLGKQYDQQTDQEKSKAFFDDLGKAQTSAEISQGRGGLVGAISGETQKELAAAGKPIRPEEVETLAAGDPLSFILFGKAFGAAGKVLPELPGGAAVVQKAGEVAAKAGGRIIQTAGKLTEFGGAATKVAGKVAPVAGGIAGAAKGASLGSPTTGLIAGLAAGERAGAALKKIGSGVTAGGERLAGLGEQVATGTGLTPYSQAARDILQAAPIVASETLKGAGFDLGLAAATSESPQETEAAAAFGTVLGGLKGVGHGALKVAQGQIIAPRAWGTTQATPAYPNSKALNALHAQAVTAASPGQVQRANAIRQFLKGAGNQVQAYLMPDAAAMEAALIARGIPAEQAKAASQSQGMFVGELADDAGKPRRVVLLNNADAAPHEAFHGIQDVLGEAANSVVDGIVFQEYAPQWESLGQQYATRLGGEGNWREVVLDRSGWGNRAAAEKALRDAANKIRNDTGAEPKATEARALAEKVLQQARENGAEWRDILTTEEAAAEANRYLARELAAENFDAAFKNLGAGLTEGKSLPEKLARVIARTAAFMGAEPLAGAQTEGLRIEPRTAVTEAVTRQGRDALTPATPAEVSKWAKLPEKPAEGAAEADRVDAWLRTASIPIADRAAAAQTLAEAMRSQQGVRLSYWGAKGEPGGDPAALRPERRAEIEAQRDAPNADRDLVTKDYFPYGAIITSKGPQFKGWSPNNFNANVARFTEWITANPAAASRIPLAHDLATEAGQRGLQADLQSFVQNQQAGFTGSGQELIVPAGTGATAPAKTGVKPVSLPQERADAISYLFNLKLPETPRITTGKLPLNIVGQRVSEATMPGRITEPIRPRGEFIGPKAEALGIEGERVREVNPFRQAVEQVARDAGTKPPELIEAAQILALERIADATVAPELPAFGGNVVTLTAGFLPGEAKSARVMGEEILRMTPDEFSTATRGYVGGLTGEARKIGLGLKSPEELASLRQFVTDAQAASKAAMARKDFDTAMAEVSKVQMFNEAIQSATGTGSNGESLRAALGADYKPPFPEGGAEAPVTSQALPRKPKNEFKLLPAGAAGSKAWVLPGGKVEQLGAQWHHDWLDKNKAVQEKYGLEVPAFEGGDAEGVREQALKKGFARVNYSRNTGTLTVEARAKDWRKQKGAVERLIEENLDNIDNVTVHLMDESVQKVVDSASERLFNYDSDMEKLANLPFITKGEVRGGSQFLPKEEASEGIRGLARGYAESAGIDYAPRTTFPAINETLAKKLADFYESAESRPDDPAVQASYRALADETMRQYETIKDAGYEIEPWTGKGEPYKTSAEAIADVRDNKHLYFLKTEGNINSQSNNPLLTDSGISIDGQRLLVNDVFRAVHDFFGHAKEGYQFGPRGEFNAWNAHSEMFSPEAQGALAAETLAQNSWVNYGPHLRNETGVIPKKGEPGYRGLTERPFAEQKNVLVPNELIAEAKAQFLPAEQTGLPGISSGREFDRKAIEGMSQAQLKEYFPEAIIPKKNSEYLSDNIVGSPLAKAAGSKEAAVQAFADKLVRDYRSRENDPMIKAGEKWYSEFTPLLKKEFGKDARIFAELLAATSPNNPPSQNFAFALDALRNWKSGRYDKMISKFNEGLNKLADGGLEKLYQRDLKAGKVKNPPEKPSDATYLAHYIDKNNLIPLGSSGKRFSMHSVPVLKVLARKWMTLNTGPKTDNFIKNLVGEGDEATIDLWAARSLRRLGYEGFQPRWRILPRNKTGVSDEDFVFSQQVFRKAADELGIKPSALQGGMWYAEKKLWSEKGWGRLDLGDYKTEMERMPQLRAGFESREARAKAEAKASAGEQNELDITPR